VEAADDELQQADGAADRKRAAKAAAAAEEALSEANEADAEARASVNTDGPALALRAKLDAMLIPACVAVGCAQPEGAERDGLGDAATKASEMDKSIAARILGRFVNYGKQSEFVVKHFAAMLRKRGPSLYLETQLQILNMVCFDTDYAAELCGDDEEEDEEEADRKSYQLMVELAKRLASTYGPAPFTARSQAQKDKMLPELKPFFIFLTKGLELAMKPTEEPEDGEEEVDADHEESRLRFLDALRPYVPKLPKANKQKLANVFHGFVAQFGTEMEQRHATADVRESVDWGALDEFAKMLPAASDGGGGGGGGSARKAAKGSGRIATTPKSASRERRRSSAGASSSSSSSSSSRKPARSSPGFDMSDTSPIAKEEEHVFETDDEASDNSLSSSDDEENDYGVSAATKAKAAAKQKQKQKRRSGSGIYTASMGGGGGLDGGDANDGESQMARWQESRSPAGGSRKSFSRARNSLSASKVSSAGAAAAAPCPAAAPAATYRCAHPCPPALN